MTHQQLLRWSLLGSLGLVPIACSGSEDTPEPGGNAGTGAEAGDSGLAGSPSVPTAGMAGQTMVGGAGGGGAKAPSCTSPSVDATSGLTTCGEGYKFRREAVACTARRGEVAEGNEGGTNMGGAGGAGAGGDSAAPTPEPTCAEPCDGEHEFCAVINQIPYTTMCRVGCLADDECGAEELCLCGPTGGVCMPADCRADADCNDGYHCAQEDGCNPNWGGFSCQQAEDECVSRADCDSGCVIDLNGSETFVCQNYACGRPFLVASRPRMASVVRRSDWLLVA